MTEVTSDSTARRKEDHIEINLRRDVQFPNLTTGLERLFFMPRALPELDLAALDTHVQLFGKTLQSPLFISSMTGGTERALPINRRLAEAAQAHGLALGVGSQRAAIENPELANTFRVREVAPDILLFANLGAVQLNYGYGLAQARQAVDMLEADALILHFNVLQEAVQPEGDTNFAGLAAKVAELCAHLPVPVIAKEVGWGFSPADIRLLTQAGVAAIDVAGAGGTSWSQVEYYRAPNAFHAQVAACFADWGIPTADALRYARQNAPHLPIFASGGIRNGLDVAKCVALGATLVGMAGAFLKAAEQSLEAVHEFIAITQAQLEVAMLCAGAPDLAALRQLELIER